jgi:hypothetical protein
MGLCWQRCRHSVTPAIHGISAWRAPLRCLLCAGRAASWNLHWKCARLGWAHWRSCATTLSCCLMIPSAAESQLVRIKLQHTVHKPCIKPWYCHYLLLNYILHLH